ncbi:MAG: restriction endonuclease subunit S [Peptococcaceae bacterium]|nr:restriction endonuclease subunit S [Peptococcaceae bacterium]
MFGDPVNHNEIFSHKKVHEFTDVVSGGTPNRSETMYWEGGTIPWVKTTELKNKFVNKTDEYITQEGLDNSAAKIVPPDTILIAMYGQGKTRGMTAYLQVEAATNQACACILPNNEVNTIYLWHYFIMSYEHLRNLAKGGNQPNLNVKMIKNYQVVVPPLDLQNQFADFVAQVDKSKFMGCNRYRIIKQPL